MRDSKNIVIGMLCAVVCIMAVAYAAFSTSLTVTTTATVSSNWCVKIKEASCPTKTTNGAADSVEATITPADNALAATFSMKFTQPGDSATCEVTYENCGSLNATLSHLAYSVTPANGDNPEVASPLNIVGGIATYKTADDGILFTISGLDNGTLNAKTAETSAGTATITVTGTFINVEAGQGNTAAANKVANIRIVSRANQAV